MKTTAAVLVELGRPLEVADLDVPALKPGQVLVEVAFCGVCHTQLLEVRGHRGEDRYLPHCLGHEGSGIVRDISPGVAKVKPGYSVILSWIKGSGADVPGSAYGWNGRTVNAGAITTFATYSVISENRLTPLPAGTLLRHAALIGCAVPTGAGVVFNTAQPRPDRAWLCSASAASGCVRSRPPRFAVVIRSSRSMNSDSSRRKATRATDCFNAKKGDGSSKSQALFRRR